MTESPPEKRPRRTARLWVVPPGLENHDEPFSGYRVLDEIRTGMGVTLWQFLRDAELWSSTPPEVRHRLFATGVAHRRRERLKALGNARDLRAPLEALSRALEGRSKYAGVHLMRACHTVSRWASEQGLPRTALAFAQSGALATPDQASSAFMVGLLARRNAEYRRAETWFRRALALGRRSGDWRHYGMACLGIGNLHRQRGDYPRARKWFLKGLRVSRRRGLWDVRPLAMHDLFCVSANASQSAEADEWARRAFKAYGPRHPRVVALAHDVARFWLNQERFDDALRVFRAVLPHVERVPERRLLVSNMARAAAGLGDRFTFASMWQETWRLVDEFEDTESVAESLVTLAEGAAALGDPDRGQLAVSHALKVAVQRNESEHRIAAERVLESLRTVRVGVIARQKPRAEPTEEFDAEQDFATHLVEALSLDFVGDLVD